MFSHPISGGPGEEVSSTAWLIALNTTTGATVFRDLEDFDFLGESLAES